MSFLLSIKLPVFTLYSSILIKVPPCTLIRAYRLIRDTRVINLRSLRSIAKFFDIDSVFNNIKSSFLELDMKRRRKNLWHNDQQQRWQLTHVQCLECSKDCQLKFGCRYFSVLCPRSTNAAALPRLSHFFHTFKPIWHSWNFVSIYSLICLSLNLHLYYCRSTAQWS